MKNSGRFDIVTEHQQKRWIKEGRGQGYLKIISHGSLYEMLVQKVVLTEYLAIQQNAPIIYYLI